MKMRKKFWTNFMTIVLLGVIGISCVENTEKIKSGNLILEVNNSLQTKLTLDSTTSKPYMTDFQPSEHVFSNGKMIGDFKKSSFQTNKLKDKVGNGNEYIFTGMSEGLEKKLVIKTYDDLPGLFSTQVFYSNKSQKDIEISKWANHSYKVSSNQEEPKFWAFQGSSTGERKDWIRPISDAYFDQNYLGMNSSDYGGGIPVTDIWRSDIGLIIGHTELVPKLVSLPTEMQKYSDQIAVAVEKDLGKLNYLQSEETISTLETFVATHQGDYYNGLSLFGQLMQRKGMEKTPSEPAAYEPIWCAWGYERNFTLDEVLGTLPKVKELGIKWAVLDDGFQQAEGDWHTNRDKFPKGDKQMKDLVQTIHDHNLKAKLWWAPLAADPGSKLLQENPDMRLYLSDWAPQYITWWDAYYLSPTQPRTLTHTQEVVDLFMNEWGFDGLKMDGQHMNAVAPDHNPESNIDDPEHSAEMLPQFFKSIYEQARSIKPNSVIENCPCGTCMSFYNMPYMNQAVSSDPLSSWQIRHKGKTYKALIPHTAYYGDHVELSDEGQDFASSFGIGAVLGTKFTWPKDNPTADASYLLTPEKEKKWKKWFSLYNTKMLSKEKYLGQLYDIGYDKPESHAIQKGDTLFYAFYAEDWDGEVKIKGLSDQEYKLQDYFNNKDLGIVSGTNQIINVKFKDFLLIQAYPKK